MKKLKKATIIYGFGQVLAKVIGFLLLPLYTNKLGSEGFGQLSLVDSIYSLFSIFIIWEITSGYVRYYYEYSDKERVTLKNTTITFSMVSSIIFLLLIIVLGNGVGENILKLEDSYYILILLVLRSAMEQMTYLFIIDYSMIYDAKKVVSIEIVKLLLNLIVVIYYVVFKEQGILGMYKGYCISNLIILVKIFIENFKGFKFIINVNMLREMFKYSIYSIPINISAIILNLSDRYVMNIFMGLSATGIYSLGYKFGMLIDPIFIVPFKKVFVPYKYQVYNDKDAQAKLNEWFIKYNMIGITCIYMISTMGKIIILITSPYEFIEAYRIIPLILISYFVYGQSEFYSLGIYITKKNKYIAYIMWISGIVNVILNFIFIPKIGMYGAAIATIISYIICNKLFQIISNKCYYFKFTYTREIMVMYIVSLLFYSIYFIISLFTKNIFMEIINVVTINLLWGISIFKLNILDTSKLRIKIKNFMECKLKQETF